MDLRDSRPLSQLTDAELDDWYAKRYEWAKGKSVVGDPAMTVILMTRPEFFAMDRENDEKEYQVQFIGTNKSDFEGVIHTAQNKSLGRAVAEAFALANGYEQ